MRILKLNSKCCLSLHLITVIHMVPVNDYMDISPQQLFLSGCFSRTSHKQTTIILLFLSQLQTNKSSYVHVCNKGIFFYKMRRLR